MKRQENAKNVTQDVKNVQKKNVYSAEKDIITIKVNAYQIVLRVSLKTAKAHHENVYLVINHVLHVS